MAILSSMKMAERSPKGRKYYGRRKNCSLQAISPFPILFSSDLYCRHVKSKDFLWKGLIYIVSVPNVKILDWTTGNHKKKSVADDRLTLYSIDTQFDTQFDTSKQTAFENIIGKRKFLVTSNFPFSHNVRTQLDNCIPICPYF